MSVDFFRQEYVKACEAAKLRPRPHIVAVCESAAESDTDVDLRCNGNAPGLRTQRLLDMDVQMLVKALVKGHPFTVFDLSYNYLGRGAAQALSTLLSRDKFLEVIDLSNNDLDEQGAALICTALQGNSTLQELRLSGNTLRGGGGMCVAELLQTNQTLRRLELHNCGFDTECLVALATVLHNQKSIEVLGLSRPASLSYLMEEPTAHFARMLAVNSTLTDIDLSKTPMRDKGLHLLSCGLLRAGTAASVRALRLQCNHICLSDAACVEAFTELLLSSSCPLTTLELGANRLNNEGALVLSEIMQGNTTLVKLGIGANSIQSRGLCALGPALAQHSTLRQATVWGNRFDSAACASWLGALDALSLDISVQEVDGSFHVVDAR